MNGNLPHGRLVAVQAGAGFTVEGLTGEVAGEAGLAIDAKVVLATGVVGMACGAVETFELAEAELEMFQPHPFRGVLFKFGKLQIGAVNWRRTCFSNQ